MQFSASFFLFFEREKTIFMHTHTQILTDMYIATGTNPKPIPTRPGLTHTSKRCIRIREKKEEQRIHDEKKRRVT